MSTSPAPAPAPKKSLSVSRIILLLILAAALGALGFDQWSKHRMGKVDAALQRLNAEAEADASGAKDILRDRVQKEIGLSPTRQDSNRFQEIEVYDFPGVFYVYRITVKYRAGINTYDGHERVSIFRLGGE